LDAGDRVEYAIEAPRALAAEPEAIALDVVYEDDDVLVVDKPAGMVTHPAHGATDGTLVNALLAHVETLPGERIRGGLVHRLDRDTSGVLVVARTQPAAAALSESLRQRDAQKIYWALTVGVPHPRRGVISLALAVGLGMRSRWHEVTVTAS